MTSARQPEVADGAPGSRDGIPAAAIVALCAASATALSFFAGAFLVDDAFISFRYAHHLAQGQGLVFNAGDRLEGYTNFLWVLLLAAAEALGFAVPRAATVLGFLLGIAALAATWLLARELLGKDDRLAPLLAVVPLAADRNFWFWAVSGMENALYAALIALGAACLLAARAGGRRPLVFGAAVLALATLARPEAPLVYAVALAVLALPPRPALRPREVALALAVFAAPLALYAAWKLWYFGELLPNTFHAKNVGAWYLAKPGRRYVLAFLVDYGFGLGLTALLAAPAIAPAGRRRAAALPAALAVSLLTYVWLVGGDIYYHYRFLTPALPFLSAGLATAVLALLARARRLGRPARLAVAAAALAGFSALAGLMSERRYREVRLRDLDLNAYREQVSAWLARGFPRGTAIATISAGIIPYRTGLRTVDLAGLTHREIGRSRVDPAAFGTLAHQKSSAGAVLRERPDLIEFRRFSFPFPLPAGSTQPHALDFADLYGPFFQNPPRYPAYRDLALREEFHRSYRLMAYPLGGTAGIATFRRLPDGAIPRAEAWSNYGWALQAEGFRSEGLAYLLRAWREAPGDAEIRRRLSLAGGG